MPRYIPKYHYTDWKDEMIFYALIPKINLQFNSLILCYIYWISSLLFAIIYLNLHIPWTLILNYWWLCQKYMPSSPSSFWYPGRTLSWSWSSESLESLPVVPVGRAEGRGGEGMTRQLNHHFIHYYYYQVYLPTDDPRDLELQGCQGGETAVAD